MDMGLEETDSRIGGPHFIRIESETIYTNLSPSEN